MSELSDKDEKETLEKLIRDHWEYISEVLTRAGITEERKLEIGFHYRTSFAHGWRHSKEFFTGAV